MVPLQLQVRDEAQMEDEVTRPIADHLVGELHVTDLRILNGRRRELHDPPWSTPSASARGSGHPTGHLRRNVAIPQLGSVEPPDRVACVLYRSGVASDVGGVSGAPPALAGGAPVVFVFLAKTRTAQRSIAESAFTCP